MVHARQHRLGGKKSQECFGVYCMFLKLQRNVWRYQDRISELHNPGVDGFDPDVVWLGWAVKKSKIMKRIIQWQLFWILTINITKSDDVGSLFGAMMMLEVAKSGVASIDTFEYFVTYLQGKGGLIDVRF